MIEQQILDALTVASPIAVIMIGLIFIVRAMPSIFVEWRKVEEVRKDGKKQDFEAQANIVAAGTRAVETAVRAMQETQTQSREFYVTKLEDMRAGMHLLEQRIQELEDQVEDKNKRIEELEQENKRLHEEIDTLRRRMNRNEPDGRSTKKVRSRAKKA